MVKFPEYWGKRGFKASLEYKPSNPGYAIASEHVKYVDLIHVSSRKIDVKQKDMYVQSISKLFRNSKVRFVQNKMYGTQQVRHIQVKALLEDIDMSRRVTPGKFFTMTEFKVLKKLFKS